MTMLSNEVINQKQMDVLPKSLYDISWQVSEGEYRQDKAISYSMLATFAKKGFRGVQEVLEGLKLDTKSIRYGSLVDTLLTDFDNFNNLYVVSDYNEPTDVIRNIINEIWDYSKGEIASLEEFAEKYDNIFLNIINANNYGGDNWRPETKIKKIIEGGEEYFGLLHLTKDGKTLVHQNDYNMAIESVNAIRTHPFTKWLFDKEHIKVYYQLKFKMNYLQEEFQYAVLNTYENPLQWKDQLLEENTIRCMFDIIAVDYKNKIIFPIDLKTTSYNEEDFETAITDWFYPIQATMYSYILREVCKVDDFFKDFKIEAFRFLPINKFNNNPQFFVYEDSVNDAQKTSFIDPKGKIHEPWYELLRKVRWHIDNSNFQYHMQTQLNRGINYVNF